MSFCAPTRLSVYGELPLHCQYQFHGFPKLIKSCSHFYRMLPYTADIRAGCVYIGCNVEIGYLVQGLVAKVKDTVANGYCS